MKISHYLLIALCVSQLTCNAQISKQGIQNTQIIPNTQCVNQSFAEKFFNQQMYKLSVYTDYKKLEERLVCPTTYLDSILMNNNKLNVAGDFANTIPFFNNTIPSLIFYVRSEQHIEGIKGFISYQNGKSYFNNLLVVFKLQQDSTWLMTDYLFKPINQGMCGLRYVDLIYNSQNKHLYLEQFGGNPFGKWGTEFEFEFDKVSRKWLHIKSNLYVASYNQGVYKNEKLVWSKTPLKKLPIDEVNYTEYFKYQELETLMN